MATLLLRAAARTVLAESMSLYFHSESVIMLTSTFCSPGRGGLSWTGGSKTGHWEQDRRPWCLSSGVAGVRYRERTTGAVGQSTVGLSWKREDAHDRTVCLSPECKETRDSSVEVGLACPSL